ncbi:MAG TPA: DUF2917 domain-containing protein [Paraburkholderia sp.]|nr:DUF2917 domain-containing protein [Paraburkholderia sp.]
MTTMQTIALERGIHRVWRVRHDSVLIVHDGSVWLTLERDPMDYWLAPGDRRAFRRCRHADRWLA